MCVSIILFGASAAGVALIAFDFLSQRKVSSCVKHAQSPAYGSVELGGGDCCDMLIMHMATI